ncbi:MAG: hypothetical protein K2Y71_15590 [Xanthobacteraceae bacterium]|nr:hypothetical protein [Xanthobacteraceae bacterium]
MKNAREIRRDLGIRLDELIDQVAGSSGDGRASFKKKWYGRAPTSESERSSFIGCLAEAFASKSSRSSATYVSQIKDPTGSPIAVQWLHSETSKFASDELRRILHGAGNHSAFAIGECIAFFLPHPLSSFVSVEVAADWKAKKITKTWDKPTRSELIACVEQHANQYPGEIAQYLKERVSTTIDLGRYHECKVGLRAVALPVKEQRLTVVVNPLTWWIVNQFNRRMVVEKNDTVLLDLRDRYLKMTLAPSDNLLHLEHPSGLYVEVTLVTADGNFLMLRKNPSKSVMADTGREWTCGIEENLLWEKMVRTKNVDIRGVIASGLYDELGIPKEQIAKWGLFAIALEQPGLNSALLGFVQIKLKAKDMEPYVKKALKKGPNPDFLGYRFQEIAGAFQATSKRKDLHPTTLMRLFLTEQVLVRFPRAKRSPT